MTKKETIWFDIDNSPHVPLFAPIIKFLKDNGYNVIVTTRNLAQTIPLLEKYNIQYIRVDGHGGASKLKKIFATLKRSQKLYRNLKDYKIDLMVNHGARAGIIAAKFLGIPIISAFDYEYNELKILKNLSSVIIAPQDLSLKFKGEKFYFYNGLKEEVYLCDFEPDHNFMQNLPFSDVSKPLITIRPPATYANYHDKLSEILYQAVLDYVLSHDCNIVLLPRDNITNKISIKDKVFIPNVPLDGANLVFHSDLVISGGGTMLREAAVLGTPAYSIFTGSPAIVDINLSLQGKLKFIKTLKDIEQIKIEKKKSFNWIKPNDNVKRFFIEMIINTLNKNQIHK